MQSLTKEEMIFYELMFDADYSEFVLAHLQPEYFPEKHQQILYKIIDHYHNKYNKKPSIRELEIAFADVNCTEMIFKEGMDLIEDLKKAQLDEDQPSIDTKWAIDETEVWCKRRAFMTQIQNCIEIMDSGKDPSQSGAMEGMQDALSVSFDREIGHEYFEQAEDRYEKYQEVENRIQFILPSFNKISNGGMEKGTLSCFLSNRTGGFKSGTMCHLAADNLRLGQNVLYITMELSQINVAKRIDANLLNMKMDDLKDYPKMTYLKQIEHIKDHYTGRLVTKQFPTSMAHAGHFRFLLKELRRKKNFIPDVVYIDYLNIAASQNLPAAARSNPYLWVKCIAEELRGLCVEFDFAGFTATQSNRGGTGASDLELVDTSESIGLPNILDLYMAIIRTEEMDDLNQIKFKQLKNRDNDEGNLRSFTMGVDMSKMKLFELDDSVLGASKTSNPLKSRGSNSSKFGEFRYD